MHNHFSTNNSLVKVPYSEAIVKPEIVRVRSDITLCCVHHDRVINTLLGSTTNISINGCILAITVDLW